MLKICLVFWKSEPQYAYIRYTNKKTCMLIYVILKKNMYADSSELIHLQLLLRRLVYNNLILHYNHICPYAGLRLTRNSAQLFMYVLMRFC